MTASPLHPSLSSLARLSDAATRLITAENVYGKKGAGGKAELSDAPQEDVVALGQHGSAPSQAARELGQGWKVRPCITVPAHTTSPLMDVEGPGVVQHIWVTTDERNLRDLIVRMYWDGETDPSVECPMGDLFCNGWRTRANVLALPINVNPSGAMNCYFPMPFATRGRMTVENRAPDDAVVFYAITFSQQPVADDEARFHAQFRRENPVEYLTDYTILDGVTGPGHYVGTYMAWQQNAAGWWGEGEIKFYLDGDAEFPTLCGTGTEDYFGGAWGFGETFSAPYLGYPLGDSSGRPGTRHGLYRFHVLDPIRFASELRVTIQALGWRSEGRYLPLQDDIASVAYWYQAEPHAPFPVLGSRDELEVI